MCIDSRRSKRQMFKRGGVVFLGSMGYPDEITPDVELS